MAYETIKVELRDAVGVIWMNRPQVHNAFDETLIAELTAACRELDGRADVRVVVLAGCGKSFSAGADVNWMKRAAQCSYDENVTDARNFAAMLRTLDRMTKPTIARVHGAALGGGTGLAAACDIVVASKEAVFAVSEVRFGIMPAVVGPYVVRAIGARQAARYFLSGERIDAETAQQIGLVHEVTEPTHLDEHVDEIVDALLRGGPGAQSQIKRLLQDIGERTIDDALVEDTVQRIARLRATDEAREGFAAFLEKQPPNWV